MENCSVIYILDTNQNSREILKSYLEEFNLGYKIKAFADYNYGVEELKTGTEKSIVFVDISDSGSSLEILETIKLYSSRIIITSIDYSTDSIVKAMRLGAKDFLPKPILKDDLKQVISKITSQCIKEDESASKIISVYSNKGGIGKTTIAANLAVEISKATGDKVALVDLNLQLGDISTFLNLKPTFDVAYVINNFLNKNEDALLQAFERYKDTTLYILSDPNYIEQSESITLQQIENLLMSLKKVFPYIIIDMSSSIDQTTLKILDKSDFIFFTTIVNIPAIRNAQRCLNLFSSRRYSREKVKILVNRYMETDDIKIEDIENTIGEKVYWKIPNNYFSIMEAINKGVSVGEESSMSNIANSFRDLAIKISDEIVRETITKYRGL